MTANVRTRLGCTAALASALLVGLPSAASADHIPGATYTGTTEDFTPVTVTVAADGASIASLDFAGPLSGCWGSLGGGVCEEGETPNCTVDGFARTFSPGAIPIKESQLFGHTFRFHEDVDIASPMSDFRTVEGTFDGPQMADGTVHVAIQNPPESGAACNVYQVWSATTTSPPVPPDDGDDEACALAKEKLQKAKRKLDQLRDSGAPKPKLQRAKRKVKKAKQAVKKNCERSRTGYSAPATGGAAGSSCSPGRSRAR